MQTPQPANFSTVNYNSDIRVKKETHLNMNKKYSEDQRLMQNEFASL